MRKMQEIATPQSRLAMTSKFDCSGPEPFRQAAALYWGNKYHIVAWFLFTRVIIYV
jgi:hypothetical protein